MIATFNDGTPVLRQVQGPPAPPLVVLGRRVTTLGRAPDCDVILQGRGVSRYHAAIIKEGGHFVLRDLGSSAGTRVDQLPASDAVALKDGSVIRIWDYVYRFGSLPLEAPDQEEATIFAAIDATAESPLVAARPEEKLRSVLAIGRAVGQANDVAEVLERALAGLFEIFPFAERGFLLLQERADTAPTAGAVRTRSGTCDVPVPSRTILERVLGTRQAILSEDTARDFPDNGSVVRQAIRTLVSAPLLDPHRRPIGLAHLDSSDPRARFRPADLDLLSAVCGVVGIAAHNAALHRQVLALEALEQELRCARRVQEALLKRREGPLPGYESWEHFAPARDVGGDYYGFFPLPRPGDPPGGPPRRWAVAVADVSGKGMPAALVMANLAAEVGSALAEHVDPAQVVTRLNRRLCATAVEEMFVTFLLVLLDVDEHRLTAVGAGHPPPLVRRSDGRVDEVASTGFGPPLAFDPDATYRAAETILGLNDVVALFTDGVPEATDPLGRWFGHDALHRTLAHATGRPTEVGAAVLRAVQGHAAGAPPSDDIVLLCFGPVPEPAPAPGL